MYYNEQTVEAVVLGPVTSFLGEDILPIILRMSLVMFGRGHQGLGRWSRDEVSGY